MPKAPAFNPAPRRTVKEDDRAEAALKEARLRLAYGLRLAPADRRWAELLAGPVERLRAFLGEDAPRAFVLCAVLPVALLPHVSPAARRAFLREMRALPFTAPASGSPQTLAEFPEAAHLLRPSTYLFLNLPPND